MAAYVFRIEFRLDPTDVRVDPNRFETVLRVPAVSPGEEGWLFFQHNCWRGNTNNEPYLRERFETALGVPVSSVAFRELETDRTYLSALKTAIAEDLGRFNAESAEDVLHAYLGSSIHVRSPD